jgi:hypothetical protein
MGAMHYIYFGKGIIQYLMTWKNCELMGMLQIMNQEEKKSRKGKKSGRMTRKCTVEYYGGWVATGSGLQRTRSADL